jgi:dynactin complex subunit
MTVSRRLAVSTLGTAPFRSPIQRVRTYSPDGKLGRIAQRAAAIRQQIDALNKQLEPLRDELTSLMIQRKLNVLNVNDVSIQLKHRNKWTYSPLTEQRSLRLSAIQKWEQEQGIATNSPTAHVAITTKK